MGSRRRLIGLAVAAVLAAAALAAAIVLTPEPAGERARPGAARGAAEGGRPLVVGGVALRRGDPFAFERGDAEELLRRGSRGHAHILYALSPGGVEASARRTTRFRDEIRTAAGREKIDPATLEALVFLESAGRPAVMADGTPESATGLTQIIPDTATGLLGMSVDVERSKQLTNALEREERRLVAARAAIERRKALGRTEESVEPRTGGQGAGDGSGGDARHRADDRRDAGSRREGDSRNRGAGDRSRGDRGDGARNGARADRDGRTRNGPDGADGRRDGPRVRPGRRDNRRPARREPPTVEDARRDARGAERAIERLIADRRRVDERFDPERALAGSVRYLTIARERFDRMDLALASYHMGIGNLQSLIDSYGGGGRQVSFAQLYFDSSPAHHGSTYERLRGFGDDSRHYLFKLEAAREIIRLWREDQQELDRLVELHAAKASAEEVLRPESETQQFEDPDELRDAYAAGDLAPLPNDPRKLGIRVDEELGELARDLDLRRGLYRGLRPEALATVVYMARLVRQAAGRRAVISVTSAVRDQGYQEALRETNAQATSEYSLHTTGYSFDVSRDLPKKQARALLFALERLRALNVADWVAEPGAYHVTVGPGAEPLLAVRPLS
jgi:hypothetical protein